MRFLRGRIAIIHKAYTRKARHVCLTEQTRLMVHQAIYIFVQTHQGVSHRGRDTTHVWHTTSLLPYNCLGKTGNGTSPRSGSEICHKLYSALYMEQRHGCHVTVSHDLKSYPFIAVHLSASKWVGTQAPRVDSSDACISQDAPDVFELTVCRDVNPWRVRNWSYALEPVPHFFFLHSVTGIAQRCSQIKWCPGDVTQRVILQE